MKPNPSKDCRQQKASAKPVKITDRQGKNYPDAAYRWEELMPEIMRRIRWNNSRRGFLRIGAAASGALLAHSKRAAAANDGAPPGEPDWSASAVSRVADLP